MKTKLLTLALFGILTLGVVACSNEEIVPANEIQKIDAPKNSTAQGGLTIRS